jgi:hypothetical protein
MCCCGPCIQGKQKASEAAGYAQEKGGQAADEASKKTGQAKDSTKVHSHSADVH